MHSLQILLEEYSPIPLISSINSLSSSVLPNAFAASNCAWNLVFCWNKANNLSLQSAAGVFLSLEASRSSFNMGFPCSSMSTKIPSCRLCRCFLFDSVCCDNDDVSSVMQATESPTNAGSKKGCVNTWNFLASHAEIVQQYLGDSTAAFCAHSTFNKIRRIAIMRS